MARIFSENQKIKHAIVGAKSRYSLFDKKMVEHAMNFEKRREMHKMMSNSPSNPRMDPILASAIKREAAKAGNIQSSRVSLMKMADVVGGTNIPVSKMSKSPSDTIMESAEHM